MVRSIGNEVSWEIYNSLNIDYKPPYWYQIIEENTDALFFKQENPMTFSRYFNNEVIMLNFKIYLILDNLSHINQLNIFKEIYNQLTIINNLPNFEIIAKAINGLIVENNNIKNQADNLVNFDFDTSTQTYSLNFEILIKQKEQNVKTNNGNKLHIALYPNETTTATTAQFHELKYITELKLNYSSKKEDRNYFHNGGETTSIITGKTTTLSVSIDYDPNDELHQYLVYLLTSEPNKCNNQFIKLEIDGVNKATSATAKNIKVATLKGKATIQFKNGIPSGAVDELIKLQFDILPQDDKWIYE
ncbi:phage tail tube protein [Mycoplasma seminis]|uniref:Uncharacterized protein n=1 Tax=Mycoplasma seminis TaxID=512749 RepID=A0ABY9H9W0_9MOLU|nr:hypothetical protein [Mycoplasma seminis]WLP85286.1 hypothetical protein Q8852_03105 [Mycoplasma seminis]